MATVNIGPCECCGGGGGECNTNCILQETLAEASLTLSGFTGGLAYLNGGYTLVWDGDFYYEEVGPPDFNIHLNPFGPGEICGAQLAISAPVHPDTDRCNISLTSTDPYVTGCELSGDLQFESETSGEAGCDTNSSSATGSYTFPAA